MPDITKLPKWAQDELSWATHRITELEVQLDALLDESGYTPQWEGDMPRVFLRQSVGTRQVEKSIGGNYTSVVFRTATEDEVEVNLIDGKLLKVVARGLAIYPEASNVVRVTSNKSY